jgi:hypothetical protein
MKLLVQYFNLKGLHLFIGIALANIFLVWLSKTFLINEIVFYNAFSDQLTYERSLILFENMKKFSWISYAITPIILFLKFSMISLVIYFGIVFFNVQNKISLKSVFKIVVASELVFLIAGIIKFFWFYLFAGNYDFNDLGFFYPISLINLFTRTEVGKIWIYPLQLVNIFQVFYILIISFALNKVYLLDKSDSEKIVLSSYVPALVLWIGLIMFLTIDFTI